MNMHQNVDYLQIVAITTQQQANLFAKVANIGLDKDAPLRFCLKHKELVAADTSINFNKYELCISGYNTTSEQIEQISTGIYFYKEENTNERIFISEEYCENLLKPRSNETENLFINLKRLSTEKKVLFGHHDDLLYGIDWYLFNGDYKKGDHQPIKPISKLTNGNYKSDTLVGNNTLYPAVFSWDLGEFDENYSYYKTNSKKFIINGTRPTDIVDGIKWAFEKGAVNTICWHCRNPLNNLEFTKPGYNDPSTVGEVLKVNSPTQIKFNKWLNNITSLFNNELRGIPIIFRPFHESNIKNAFWCDKLACTDNQFKELWNYVFNYFAKENVTNVLFCYSINDPNEEKVFDKAIFNKALYDRMPADEYFDFLGLDSYLKQREINTVGVGRTLFEKRITDSLSELYTIAKLKNKVAILSEFGVENNRFIDPLINNKAVDAKMIYPDFWDKELTKIIKLNNIPIVVMWRNATIYKDIGEKYFFSVHPDDSNSVIYFNKMLNDNKNLLLQVEALKQNLYKK